MTHIGSPDEWIALIDSQVPDIIELVVETWKAMPAPSGNELEDVVSEALCRALRQSRNSRDLPFIIHTQQVELDPDAGQDQGRMDIVFSPLVPRENIYFCLECKRLNVRTTEGVRPYFVEYVRLGMLRFIRGQYSNSVLNGGMLAFVLDGDIPSAMAGVDENIKNLHFELAMKPPGELKASTVRRDDPLCRETEHLRRAGEPRFTIYHLFVAGDPAAPLRIEASTAASGATKKRSLKAMSRRKKSA